MTTFRIRLLYTLYALSAVVFFLFFLFPGESVKKVFIGHIEREFPPYQLRIDVLKPEFPPGIQLSGLSLMDKDEALLVSVKEMRLFPGLSRLIRGQILVRFHGTAYEGTFSGDLDCGKGGWDQAERVAVAFANLKIKETALKAIQGSPLISGILDGNVTYSQAEKTPGTIDATLSLTNAALVFPAVSETLAPIAFETVDAAFSIERQTLNFRQFVFAGPQLEGAITGTVRLLDPAGKSNLNLRLDISIRPEFQDKLSELVPLVLLPSANSNQSGYKLRIFGTLETPSVSITR